MIRPEKWGTHGDAPTSDLASQPAGDGSMLASLRVWTHLQLGNRCSSGSWRRSAESSPVPQNSIDIDGSGKLAIVDAPTDVDRCRPMENAARGAPLKEAVYLTVRAKRFGEAESGRLFRPTAVNHRPAGWPRPWVPSATAVNRLSDTRSGSEADEGGVRRGR